MNKKFVLVAALVGLASAVALACWYPPLLFFVLLFLLLVFVAIVLPRLLLKTFAPDLSKEERERILAQASAGAVRDLHD